MAGTDFNEEIDCGSFFDQFDDLIEFPTDDKCNDFPSIWSSESFSGAGPIFSINNSSTVSDLSAELAVPVPVSTQILSFLFNCRNWRLLRVSLK